MNINTGGGVQVCLSWRKSIFTCVLYYLSCTAQSVLQGLPLAHQGFHGHVFKNLKPHYHHLGNNSFIPISPWKFLCVTSTEPLITNATLQHGLPEARASGSPCWLWISRVLSKKQILSCFPRIMRVSDIFFPFVVKMLPCQIGWTCRLELKKTTHLPHVLFLWWFT